MLSNCCSCFKFLWSTSYATLEEENQEQQTQQQTQQEQTKQSDNLSKANEFNGKQNSRHRSLSKDKETVAKLSSILKLDPMVAELSPTSYETNWHEFGESKDVCLHFTREPSLKHLEELLGECYIFTLASGSLSRSVKLYVYGADIQNNLILAELVFDITEEELHVRIKTDERKPTSKTNSENLGDIFLEYLKIVLHPYIKTNDNTPTSPNSVASEEELRSEDSFSRAMAFQEELELDNDEKQSK